MSLSPSHWWPKQWFFHGAEFQQTWSGYSAHRYQVALLSQFIYIFVTYTGIRRDDTVGMIRGLKHPWSLLGSIHLVLCKFLRPSLFIRGYGIVDVCRSVPGRQGPTVTRLAESNHDLCTVASCHDILRIRMMYTRM